MGHNAARLVEWLYDALVEHLVDEGLEVEDGGRPRRRAGDRAPRRPRRAGDVRLAAAAGRRVRPRARDRGPRDGDRPALGRASPTWCPTPGCRRSSRSASWPRLVDRFGQRSADVIAGAHGRLVKTVGDEVLFVADSAAAAATDRARARRDDGRGPGAARRPRRHRDRHRAHPDGRRLRPDGQPGQPADRAGRPGHRAGRRRDRRGPWRAATTSRSTSSGPGRSAGWAWCGPGWCGARGEGRAAHALASAPVSTDSASGGSSDDSYGSYDNVTLRPHDDRGHVVELVLDRADSAQRAVDGDGARRRGGHGRPGRRRRGCARSWCPPRRRRPSASARTSRSATPSATPTCWRSGRTSARCFGGILDLPVPTIAAVHGFALGGGLELALSCDLIVADETAVLGLPEVTVGVIPGGGGTQLLTRRIGSSRAADLVFTGRRLDVDEAERIGLVDRRVPAGTDRDGGARAGRHDRRQLAGRGAQRQAGPAPRERRRPGHRPGRRGRRLAGNRLLRGSRARGSRRSTRSAGPTGPADERRPDDVVDASAPDTPRGRCVGVHRGGGDRDD